MFVIAANISTRTPAVRRVFRQALDEGWNEEGHAARTLKQMARECARWGARAIEINTQAHYNRPEAMRFAASVAGQAGGVDLVLSTGSADVLAAGLGACRKRVLANYVSLDVSELKEILPMAAERGAGVILLASSPAAPADADEMLKRTAVLVGAALGLGIKAGDILVDPGLIHVTSDIGQRHLREIVQFLRALPEATDPPVKSTCWLANGSAGAPRRFRPVIETALLPLLAGAGLDSVFIDVLSRDNRRALRLIKMFYGELVYSESELEK